MLCNQKMSPTLWWWEESYNCMLLFRVDFYFYRVTYPFGRLRVGWRARIFRNACPRGMPPAKVCPVPLRGMPGHGKFTVTLKYIYVFCNFPEKKESNVREVPIVHLRVQGFQPAYPIHLNNVSFQYCCIKVKQPLHPSVLSCNVLYGDLFSRYIKGFLLGFRVMSPGPPLIGEIFGHSRLRS